VLHYAKNPSYTVTSFAQKESAQPPEKHFVNEIEGRNAGDKPVILVSIGSGVSIIKVSAFDSFERVAGTMIGGGTLIGLSNLLTGVKDFDQIINLANSGNHQNVDMLVRDIYGSNSPFKELQGDLLASSFAKIANDQEGDIRSRFK